MRALNPRLPAGNTRPRPARLEPRAIRESSPGGGFILIDVVLALTILLLIAAVVIVTLVWGMIRGIQHRVRNRAELARVTHLRPASTGQRELKRTPAHASWRGPSAA